MSRTAWPLLAATLCACSQIAPSPAPAHPTPAPASTLPLGAFSVSLAVRDLAASRAFYEQLGFAVAGGVAAQNWLILRNGTTTIGLFQGMFERNALTFNPGWSAAAQPLAEFEDVRAIQRRLEEQGVTLATRCDPDGTGPAHITLVDPDGNPVLIDQHVAAPGH